VILGWAAAAHAEDTAPAAAEWRRSAARPHLKRRLSIFSALILDSRVDDGTPSRAAAPNGPDTRPLLSASAASMASFSCVASVLVGVGATVGAA